ncbi:MAG TPA: helix-hairpin-helix domain-containing protein [Polyangiaceae bacterium]|nr:helix-hairpin-helix domain-containing protein [Polyangiaceae bacterium]
MAIEDFEWEGDVERALPTATTASGAHATESWLSRLKKSVWLEPALRAGGTALLLAVLAGIGVVATTYAKPGLQLPEGSRSLVAALGTSWLKPTASAAPVAASASASVPALAVPVAVPVAAPSAAPEPSPPPVADTGAARGITPDGKVVLNVASADELTQLPGIGMKRALAIVALRTKLKRFKHPTDLLRVKGIGPRGLQRMLPHLVLDAQ